jgi:hypothetical protein
MTSPIACRPALPVAQVARSGLSRLDSQADVRELIRRNMVRVVDIETVSQYCGVSVATIRKTYRHVMPGTFDNLLGAAHTFGR